MKKGRNLSSVNTDGGVNLQFKLLSAIGIIIIVSGHCYHGGMELAYNWFPPYSYNLALFVFISGYFYKTDYEENVGKYIWKRTKRLLIPAYLWNIFYGGMVAFLGLFGFTIGAKPDLYNLFVMPFVDGEAFQYNLGSWFVYPLFLVCIINVLFRKFLKLIHLDNEFIVLIVYLAIGMIGINTAIENPTAINGIVKLLVRTMFFLPCYEFGRFYKAVLEKKDTLNNVAYFAIIFAVQLILLTFCKDLEYTPSSFAKFNNGFIIPYISSITAIAFWLRVSRLLVPAIGNSKLVRLIADNTYGIMVNQQGSPFYTEDAHAMQRSHKRIASTFPISRVYQAHIPTFAAGYWLFGFASKKYHPIDDLDAAAWKALNMRTRYYTTRLHVGAFYLPAFLEEMLREVEEH